MEKPASGIMRTVGAVLAIVSAGMAFMGNPYHLPTSFLWGLGLIAVCLVVITLVVDYKPRKWRFGRRRSNPALEAIARLEADVHAKRARWMESGCSTKLYAIWAQGDVEGWWNDARKIPGAPSPPEMPPPFPGPSNNPQEGLAATDRLLQWLAELKKKL
jgi:hypothetical protein